MGAWMPHDSRQPGFDLKNPRNFPEDFPHENGCYQCQCGDCGNGFLGHKRRVRCKLCEGEKKLTQRRGDGEGAHEAFVNGRLTWIYGDTWDQAVTITKLTAWLQGQEPPRIQMTRPFIDPEECSIEELEEILATDVFAAPAYEKALEAKKQREREVTYYEEKYES